jgi:hypothetical protein
MAAALLDHHAQGRVHVRSAGSTPANEINPAVVQVMAEIGLDLTKEFPKPLTTDVVQGADVVITLRGHGRDHRSVYDQGDRSPPRPSNLSDLLEHLLVVVGGVAAQLSLLALRDGRPGRNETISYNRAASKGVCPDSWPSVSGGELRGCIRPRRLGPPAPPCLLASARCSGRVPAVPVLAGRESDRS